MVRFSPSVQPPAFKLDGYNPVFQVLIYRNMAAASFPFVVAVYTFCLHSLSLLYFFSSHIRALLLFVDRALIYRSVDRTLLNILY